MVDAPEIVPGTGVGFTDITSVSVVVPHILVFVYRTVSDPVAIPVIVADVETELASVALPLLMLHVPPGTVSVKVIADDRHTILVLAPIATAGANTVIAFVVVAVHQVFVVVYFTVALP